MNARIQKYLADSAASLKLLAAFGEKFDIPEGLGWPCANEERATFSISLRHRFKSDAEKALQFAGDTWGRNGWTAKPNYERTGFDWRKVVDGVIITISDAEQMPKEPDEIPVPPSKFPIQLEEKTSE